MTSYLQKPLPGILAHTPTPQSQSLVHCSRKHPVSLGVLGGLFPASLPLHTHLISPPLGTVMQQSSTLCWRHLQEKTVTLFHNIEDFLATGKIVESPEGEKVFHNSFRQKKKKKKAQETTSRVVLPPVLIRQFYFLH